VTRWIKIPGPGQFRGEGEWRTLEECCTDENGRFWMDRYESVWKQAQGYLPTCEQETKPKEKTDE